MGKHVKHPKLTRRDSGSWAPREISFLGAPCGVIRDLALGLATEMEQHRLVFVDESHSDPIDNLALPTWTKNGVSAAFDQHAGNEFDAKFNFAMYDLALVNGNHFLADSQIVILDERKFESLERKSDRLSDVKAVLIGESTEMPEFLKDIVASDVPRFNIKDVKAISDWMSEEFLKPSPVFGLLLSGGRSTRMGQDKSLLNFHGTSQRQHMYGLLSNHCDEVFTSCRADQVDEFASMNPLPDRLTGMGPFGAIISAFMHNPNVAWLVSAVDLPFVDDSCLGELISNRNPSRAATAFQNEETGFVDPLITIWESRSYMRLLQFLNQGYSCPRKVLINSDVEVINPSDSNWLRNVNSPADLENYKLTSPSS